MKSHFGEKFERKKTEKSRNICRVSGGYLGAWDMVIMGTNQHCAGTHTKCSQIAFAVTFIALIALERNC